MPIYLRYGPKDKIKGDVKEPAHSGWIELQSAQLGVHRGVSSPTGGSAGRGDPPPLSEIVVTKKSDKASMALWREALTGEGVTAVIEFARADGSVYLRVEMTGTLISSYNIGGSGEKPTESLSLNFTKVEFKNIPGTPSTDYDEDR